MNNDLVPKVLIVDDLPENRLVARLVLKSNSEYQFIEAENGLEAVKITKKELPDIILMDAMMPVMDGFEAIRRIREDKNTKNIPIIMVSALDNKDEKVKALQSGISDFISKPFDKTELTIRVNSLLHLYMQFNKKRLELEDINANLERKVKEKLDKKLHDVKMASIGQMAAGITHELNTPITYMKSNLEMLGFEIEDIEGNEKVKESILETKDILEKGIKRIRNIIDTTREVTKKGQNKRIKQNLYSTLIISLRMIYNRSKHLMPIYINDTYFDIEIDENLEVYESSVVKEQIEQVWIIILNNACDEFEKSEVLIKERKLDISIYGKDDKTFVKFKDNASGGISDEIIDKIFEPFVSTKTQEGMGIGLNIAKEIIENHNGIIKAYNEDNCAVFEIEI